MLDRPLMIRPHNEMPHFPRPLALLTYITKSFSLTHRLCNLSREHQTDKVCWHLTGQHWRKCQGATAGSDAEKEVRE